MRLILLTGISGTGKTTVMKELVRRGRAAYDTDKHDLSIWINKQTGQPLEANPRLQYGTPEWFETYSWTLQVDQVNKLAAQSRQEVVYFCGVPANARNVAPLFDAVFCLVLDDQTLKHRLLTRTDNDYGKKPNQLQDILRWNKDMEVDFKALGAPIVDASWPVGKIVDFITETSES